MVVAVATYHRRDEMDDVPKEILRPTARAEFAGDPPPVCDWLADGGVEA
jgi:hypothetical protein